MKHNWEYKPFKQLSDILYGCPFESEFFNSESKGMPLIRIRDVKPGYTSTYFNGGYSDDYIIKKGDYLIGMDGEFNIAPWQSEDALLNQRVCRVKSINENVILSNFIYYFLGKELKDIEDQTSFVTVKHLSAKVLNAINTPVPPMEVQERIVAELDKINETIEDCRELLRNLDALAQSLFYDYFGDPITNPYNFPKSKLDQLCNIVGRIGFRGYTRNDLVEAGQGAITLSPTNIVNGVVTYDKNTYISWDKYDESPEIMIFDGDVLLTKTGSTVGKIGIVKTLPEKATINPQLVVLKNLKLNNWYITFTLRKDAYQEIIREKSGGSAVPTISQKILGTISLPVPPLELQEKFAERIEQIEAQKEAVESTIAELQTLLDSRMDYWFN